MISLSPIPATASDDASTDLPLGWEWTCLGVLCSKIQDGTHFSPKVQYEEPGADRYMYITAKNIREHGIDLADLTFVDRDVHQSIFSRCNPEFGDVLLVKDGVNTGTVAINSLQEEFALLSSVALLKPVREIVDARYIKHYLSSPSGFSTITGQMTGTAIKRIILEKIRIAPLPLPPLAEQHRIVAAIETQLTRLDAGVASLRAAQAKLRRYRASVLKAACEGRLVAQDPSDEPASALLQRILAERHERWAADLRARGKDPAKAQYAAPAAPDVEGLPELPAGWVWATVEQVAADEPNSITDGPFGSNLKTEHYTESGPRVIRLQNIGNGQFIDAQARISDEHFKRLQRHQVKGGDLVIAALGEKLPRACVIPGWVEPAIVKADCIRLKNHNELAVNLYLNAALNSEILQKVAARIVHGIGRPRLNQQEIKSLPIPLPPLAEQRRIVAEVERRLSVVAAMESAAAANLRRAARLRQAILKRAFEGRLVPQDPSDEPASALLERIRASRQERADSPAKNGRRGRPPEAASAAQASNDTAPRRRGRPRKAAAQPTGRSLPASEPVREAEQLGLEGVE